MREELTLLGGIGLGSALMYRSEEALSQADRRVLR